MKGEKSMKGKKHSAKLMVMQPMFKSKVEKDKKKYYKRNQKHKNRGPDSSGRDFFIPSLCA